MVFWLTVALIIEILAALTCYILHYLMILIVKCSSFVETRVSSPINEPNWSCCFHNNTVMCTKSTNHKFVVRILPLTLLLLFIHFRFFLTHCFSIRIQLLLIFIFLTAWSIQIHLRWWNIQRSSLTIFSYFNRVTSGSLLLLCFDIIISFIRWVLGMWANYTLTW